MTINARNDVLDDISAPPQSHDATATPGAPLPENWLDLDGSGCFDVLVEHARERHLRGEPLHPAWLPGRGHRP